MFHHFAELDGEASLVRSTDFDYQDLAGGALRPDLSRPGHGLELRTADAEAFAA